MTDVRKETGDFADRASTGIAAFDELLGGGFPRNRLYLVDGDPGTGKTTVGIQFLLEGVRRGEPALYVTLCCCATSSRTRRCIARSRW